MASKATQKSCKIDPGIIRNPLHAKVDFCNTSITKGLFLQSQTPKFPLKNHQNKQLGNRYDKISFFFVQKYSKAPKMVPLNQQEIDKIQAWTSQDPSVCPPMSQDRPRINLRSGCKNARHPASRSQRASTHFSRGI